MTARDHRSDRDARAPQPDPTDPDTLEPFQAAVRRTHDVFAELRDAVGKIDGVPFAPVSPREGPPMYREANSMVHQLQQTELAVNGTRITGAQLAKDRDPQVSKRKHEDHTQWESRIAAADEAFRDERDATSTALDAQARALPDAAARLRENLAAAALPGDDLTDGERARAADECRMVLDAVPADDLDQLAATWTRLADESGYGGPETRLLLSSWGRRYLQTRGMGDALQSALRHRVLAQAAEHGNLRQQAAAHALTTYDKLNISGYANSLASVAATYRDQNPPREPLRDLRSAHEIIRDRDLAQQRREANQAQG